MSEEQDRPLTRRELRERERLQSANSDDAAGGAPDEQSIVEEPPPARLPEPPTGAIPLIGPDGKPRSRREMRELWAAEQERLEADSGGAPVADEVTETELDSAEEAAAQAAERALSDSHLLDTQAMSLDELAGAERAAEDEPSAPDAPREHAEDEDDSDDEIEPPHTPVSAGRERSSFSFPWSRNKQRAAEAEDDADGAVVSTEPEADAEPVLDAEPVEAEVVEAEPVETEIVETEIVETEAELPEAELSETDAETEAPEPEVIEVEAVPAEELPAEELPVAVIEVEAVAIEEIDGDEDVPAEAEPVAEPETPALAEYSFPDIAPLEEERSVFDDPSTTTLTSIPDPLTQQSGVDTSADFDDLISHAVAAEVSGSNTGALILPAMPDTGDLTGSLNDTGEIYITGSIELPKSLGETGGHARLFDTVETDDDHFAEDTGASTDVPDDGTAPVSATRAISAQASNNAIVTPATTKGNKLPLILSISGGGLLLAVIGLFIWGATNGMFG